MCCLSNFSRAHGAPVLRIMMRQFEPEICGTVDVLKHRAPPGACTRSSFRDGTAEKHIRIQHGWIVSFYQLFSNFKGHGDNQCIPFLPEPQSMLWDYFSVL
jgi:hypothetical protein